MWIVIKIIRNISIGLFLTYAGFQLLESENEKEKILLSKYVAIEITVRNYEVKKVQLGYIIRNRGFLTATNGQTYLCDDTSDLKRNDPAETFKNGPIKVWLKKYKGDGMIYQIETSKGIVLPFSSTLSNDEVPKKQGAYLIIGLGIFFSIGGFLAAFLFNKEKKEF